MYRRNHLGINPGARPSASMYHLSPELQLNSIISGRPRKDQLRSGKIASRIAELVPGIEAKKIAALAIEAHEQMRLRYVPLVLVREMARHKTHRAFVAETLANVIRRPEELVEFVELYWKDGRVPLSSQIKKGLAAAFPRFDERQLARCTGKQRVRLRDVLFLCHAKPGDEAQAAVWKRLVWGRLSPNRSSQG
jgi:hypothetical protein